MESLKRFHWRSLNPAKKIGTLTTLLAEPAEASKLIVGYTTREHLIVDLDNEPSLSKIVRLVKMIQKDFPYLGDCLICQSSGRGFHLIFNDKIRWQRVLQVARILAGLGLLNRDYIKIRNFREDLTLRVSSVDRKYKKSAAPLPVAIVAPSGIIFHKSMISLVCILSLYDDPFSPRFSGIVNYLQMLSAFRPLSGLTIPIH